MATVEETQCWSGIYDLAEFLPEERKPSFSRLEGAKMTAVLLELREAWNSYARNLEYRLDNVTRERDTLQERLNDLAIRARRGGL